MIAGGNHTIIQQDGFLRGSAEFRTSPMLTSLGTFLFSNKKVPLRRIQCSKRCAKFQFIELFAVMNRVAPKGVTAIAAPKSRTARGGLPAKEFSC